MNILELVRITELLDWTEETDREENNRLKAKKLKTPADAREEHEVPAGDSTMTRTRPNQRIGKKERTRACCLWIMSRKQLDTKVD